ncbi:Lpg1974 family pore-forming outer membrane protein [Bradyrhizobium sp. USDA 4486]
MKTILALMLGATAALTASGAAAGELEDVNARLERLERQNAAIRKENAALRENQRLHQGNIRLKSQGAQASVESARTGARSHGENGTFSAVSAASRQAKNPLQSYAADFPVKAPPLAGPALFRAWVEGGAIWSGGDPVLHTYFDITGVTGVFALTPKVGWETAIGFDHRFAASPWHINGQFRYGEGGETNGTRTINFAFPLGVIGTQTFGAAYKETHWLADLAIGHDIAGRGPDALQLKAGLRIAEFTARSSDPNAETLTGLGLSYTTSNFVDTRASFLGAGPLIGLEGSVPFAGTWSFDYHGDVALLVGRQQQQRTVRSLSDPPPPFEHVTTDSNRIFAGSLSADIQVGISYWLTQNLKLGASYRLDAFVNVFNEAGSSNNGFTPDRYTHGPRVTLTGQFDAM